MINIVVALPCEARPLIDHLRLRKRSDVNAFPVYSNVVSNVSAGEDGVPDPREVINLIVSGPGRLAAATATAFLQGVLQQSTAAWLNLGIAGSGTFAVGEPILALRITDNTTGKRFYPGLCFDLPCATAELLSVEIPQTQYAGRSVYEMEAAGFYSAAMRFAPCEVIHCLKFISDTHEQSIQSITEAMVTDLITAQMNVIQQIIRSLQQQAKTLSGHNASPSGFDIIINTWRFSVSQQHQLKSLLWRWQTLTEEPVTRVLESQSLKHAKQILQHLEQQLSLLPVRLDN